MSIRHKKIVNKRDSFIFVEFFLLNCPHPCCECSNRRAFFLLLEVRERERKNSDKVGEKEREESDEAREKERDKSDEVSKREGEKGLG